MQPEQSAANVKLLEELKAPLVHAWPLDARDTWHDVGWLRMVLTWGLDLNTQDSQGRSLLYAACEVQRALCRCWDGTKCMCCCQACCGACAQWVL